MVADAGDDKNDEQDGNDADDNDEDDAGTVVVVGIARVKSHFFWPVFRKRVSLTTERKFKPKWKKII